MQRRTWFGSMLAFLGFAMTAKGKTAEKTTEGGSPGASPVGVIKIENRLIMNAEELFADVEWFHQTPNTNPDHDGGRPYGYSAKHKTVVAWLDQKDAVLISRDDDEEEYEVVEEPDMEAHAYFSCHGVMKLDLHELDGYQWIIMEPIKGCLIVPAAPKKGIAFRVDDPDLDETPASIARFQELLAKLEHPLERTTDALCAGKNGSI